VHHRHHDHQAFAMKKSHAFSSEEERKTMKRTERKECEARKH